MSQPIANTPGLLLSDDLIFTSRIVAHARAQGYEVRTSRTGEDLLRLAEQHRPGWVLVDLGNPGLKLSDVVVGLRKSIGPDVRVIAYGSHVDVESLKAARVAGCDPVLPRSKFVEDLPTQLSTWIASSP